MDLKLQIIIGVGSVVMLIYIISMIGKGKLELKYSLLWIFADISIMILSIFPKGIDLIALILGVAEPINIMFFLGIVFLGMIILSLTIAQSRNSNKLKDLVQKVALLEKKNEEQDNN